MRDNETRFVFSENQNLTDAQRSVRTDARTRSIALSIEPPWPHQTVRDQAGRAFEELLIFSPKAFNFSLSASSIPRICLCSFTIGTMISDRVV